MTAIPNTQSTFSNVQWELLKMFEYNVSENQLLEIKQLLVRYFSNQIDNDMDKLWEQNQWSSDTIEEWANGHFRSKSKK